VLSRVRELGIGLSIDDFGTGYSSLAYLINLPLDVLKINRAFVSGLDSGTGHEEMVRTILGLARNLGLRVIADGVESPQHGYRLAAVSCGVAQVFFFVWPLRPYAAEQVVRVGRVHSSFLPASSFISASICPDPALRFAATGSNDFIRSAGNASAAAIASARAF